MTQPVSSWETLIRDDVATAVTDLQLVVTMHLDRVRRMVTRPDVVRGELGALAIVLSRAAVLIGPEPTLPAIAALMEFLPTGRDSVLGEDKGYRADATEQLLRYVNIALACGRQLPGELASIEAELISAVVPGGRRLPIDVALHLAFASLAIGRADWAREFLDERAPSDFKPSARFRNDIIGFLLYVASVLETGETETAVAPAWLQFVDDFPIRLAARYVGWQDLLWAARAVHNLDTGRQEPAAQPLYDLVWNNYGRPAGLESPAENGSSA
jgi:hypothetical protein